MKYKTLKMEYLDLRNKLSYINGYIKATETFVSYSYMDDEKMVNDKKLSEVMLPLTEERREIQTRIIAIELSNKNYNDWLF